MIQKENLKVFIDGTSRPHGAGVGVYIPRYVRYSAKVQASRGDISEYIALIHALKLIETILDSKEFGRITILTDSQGLVNHVNGTISPNNGELKVLKEEIDRLLDKVEALCVEIIMTHYPKRNNFLPHSLAKKGAKL
jgi:ribonuclease HI